MGAAKMLRRSSQHVARRTSTLRAFTIAIRGESKQTHLALTVLPGREQPLLCASEKIFTDIEHFISCFCWASDSSNCTIVFSSTTLIANRCPDAVEADRLNLYENMDYGLY